MSGGATTLLAMCVSEITTIVGLHNSGALTAAHAIKAVDEILTRYDPSAKELLEERTP